MKEINIIVAIDEKGGIGKDGKIPWISYEDILYFKNITQRTKFKDNKNAIIMGSKTWLKINKYLKKRLNIILSKRLKGENIYDNLEDALNKCENDNNIEKIFIIGGEKVYKQTINHINLRKIYITRIKGDYNCDKKFPIEKLKYEYNLKSRIQKENIYEIYETIENKNERGYLNIVNKVLNSSDKRMTRNGFTLSIFGEQLKFNLRNEFPLLTTKKVFFKGIFEELMFFIRGETNTKILSDKKVNIWTENTTKEFIKSMNLDYEEYDMGPMYGFNWRYFNADYNGMHQDYKGKGYDQLLYVLNTIKNDPTSRRIIMTTFNPQIAQKGVLYPCWGIVNQFYVKKQQKINYISCHMYIRSSDIFLGLPFNIASTGLFVYLICEILTNTTNFIYMPDEIIISFGDIHIYQEHIHALQQQIIRIPFNFPQIKFKRKVNNIEDFQYDDVLIENYKSYNTIKSKMIP
jgi:dihydrofolate reductase/thymidylate synthase